MPTENTETQTPSGDEFDMESAVAELGEAFGAEVPGPAEAESAQEPVPPAAETPTPPPEAEPKTPAPWSPPEQYKALFDDKGRLKSWRAESAAEFQNLPEIVQQEILKREDDAFKGIAQYKEAAEVGQSFQKVLAPYQPLLRQYGIDPVRQVEDLMRAQYTLVAGSPEHKAQLFQQLAKQYNVDLAALGEATAYTDPQVQYLQSRLEELQSQVLKAQQESVAASQRAYQQQVEAFAADPKNVYFEELVPDMTKLLQSGVETSLEGAYAKALWMNPAVREKELARQQAEAQAKAQAEAEAKAQATQAATAVNLRSQARGGSSTAPLGSMDDTLQEALAAIQSRAG